MTDHLMHDLAEALTKVSGFIYPNEVELQWSILIAVYPYITGLVAGAFILASLERVFNVEAVKPTYRLALLSALSFLIVAPLPLQLHLGHPERSFSIFMTPQVSSAMAMFGFVYAWYLMAVLLLEIWLDYRKEIIARALGGKSALERLFYRVLALGVLEATPRSLEIDEKLGKIITIIGLPSAVLLHGYVGFIFGSVKANPWWSTPLMPVIFLFSAMASGIAVVNLIYAVSCRLRKVAADMNCMDTTAKFLLTAIIVAFSLEMLETIQTLYEAHEHLDIIKLLVEGRLFWSMVVLQALVGAIIPMVLLGIPRMVSLSPATRKTLYITASSLSLIGIFAMRWNVVMGGQLFSKSLLGFTTFKVGLAGLEGVISAAFLILLPFAILAVLVRILPPWTDGPVQRRNG